MSRSKNQHLHVKISEEEKRSLEEVALKKDVPASQIVREAVRDRVAELTRELETAADAAAAA